MAMSAKWSHLPTKSKYKLFFVLCISSVKAICSKRQYLFSQTPFPFAKHPFCKIIASQEFRKIHGRFANTLPANKHKKQAPRGLKKIYKCHSTKNQSNVCIRKNFLTKIHAFDKVFCKNGNLQTSGKGKNALSTNYGIIH